MGKSKNVSLLCGLPPFFFVAYYFLAICISGYPIAAINPLKELLRQVHSPLSFFPDEPLEVATKAFEDLLLSALNRGNSVAIFGAVLAASCDLVGPKITAVSGQLLLIAGYVLMFLFPSVLCFNIGCVLMGLSFMAIFVSHSSVAALYPAQMSLVLAIIGAAPDISLAIPTVLNAVSFYLGGRTTIIGYLCILSSLAFCEVILVPSKPFSGEDNGSASSPEEESALMDDHDTLEKDAPAPVEVPFTSLLFGQIATVHFLLLSLYTGLNVFRKLYFSQLVEGIFSQIAKDGGIAPAKLAGLLSFFNISLSSAFIPAIAMGAVATSRGVVAATVIQNTFGTLLFVACSFSVFYLQYVTVALYSLMSCYVFGLVFVFLASFCGFRTMGILQGIQFTVAALFVQGFQFYNSSVIPLFPSLVASNRVMVILGVVMFIFPAYIALRPPRKVSEVVGEEYSVDPQPASRGVRNTLGNVGAAPLMDRTSFMLLNKEAKAAAR